MHQNKNLDDCYDALKRISVLSAQIARLNADPHILSKSLFDAQLDGRIHTTRTPESTEEYFHEEIMRRLLDIFKAQRKSLNSIKSIGYTEIAQNRPIRVYSDLPKKELLQSYDETLSLLIDNFEKVYVFYGKRFISLNSAVNEAEGFISEVQNAISLWVDITSANWGALDSRNQNIGDKLSNLIGMSNPSTKSK